MHPYDAKSNFFSEVDVLRVAQSNRPPAAVKHVTVALSRAGADAGAAAVGGFVSTECSLLLLHAYNVCVCVFCIRSKALCRMHFYQCFSKVSHRRLRLGR
jgi:hypothetical protein